MAECRGKAKFLIIWKLPEATAKPEKKKKKERKKERKSRLVWSVPTEVSMEKILVTRWHLP